MFMTRFFGRSFLAAAKSESSAASGAAATMATSGHNPLEELFEKDRTLDDQKPVYGTTTYLLIVPYCSFAYASAVVILCSDLRGHDIISYNNLEFIEHKLGPRRKRGLTTHCFYNHGRKTH